MATPWAQKNKEQSIKPSRPRPATELVKEYIDKNQENQRLQTILSKTEEKIQQLKQKVDRWTGVLKSLEQYEEIFQDENQSIDQLLTAIRAERKQQAVESKSKGQSIYGSVNALEQLNNLKNDMESTPEVNRSQKILQQVQEQLKQTQQQTKQMYQKEDSTPFTVADIDTGEEKPAPTEVEEAVNTAVQEQEGTEKQMEESEGEE